MRSRTWLFATLGLMAAVAAAVLALNVSLDIYGLFRDPRGRQLPAYGDSRIAKYLLCERYVPANFDALLIGSSVTANWNTGGITTLRVYNLSVNAGNMVEEQSIARGVIANHRMRAALMLVHPYLLESHEFKTVRLSPREKTAAIGSLSLWNAYKEMINIRLGRSRQETDAFGTTYFDVRRQPLNATLSRMMQPGTDFGVDPIAWTAYRETVAALHARGVPVVFVVPPLAESLLAPKRAAFGKFLDSIRPLLGPSDKILDFTGDEYAGLRLDREAYSDGVHLKLPLAQEVIRLIDARLREWLARGELRRL